MTNKRLWVTVTFGVCVGVVNGFCADGAMEAAGVGQSSTKITVSAKKPSEPAYDKDADAKRKAAMSSEELAWELVLEKNLRNYLDGYKKNKLAGQETAWDYVKDNPTLPRVLLIGDSISRGYTLPVRHALAGKANVHRAPRNCGSSDMGANMIDYWLLVGGGKWDIIHFNFGIWDRSTKDEVYAANLEKVVEKLKKTGAKLIWATTTPPASGNNGEKFTPEQCKRINDIADAIMKKHGIAIDDLCAFVTPKLAELQQTNNVHFNDAGYTALGDKVAAEIQSQLKGK